MPEINITVSDTEVYFRPGSVRVSRALNARGTAQFRIRATKAMPQAGEVVGVFDRGIRIFGGTVQEVTLTPIVTKGGSEAWYDVTATAWEHWLERAAIPAVSYDCVGLGYTAGDVVQALITQFALDDVLIGQCFPGLPAETLGIVIFRQTNVWAAIGELAERCNFICYVTPERELYFGPREMSYALSEVRASNLNYREPQVTTDRADYYNKVSMTISYDAFDPFICEFNGDVCYPHFDVYDPADPLQTPVPIDLIRYIRINGVDQSFGVKVLNEAGEIENRYTFYYQTGSPRIVWDDLEASPAADDVISIEFYEIGANVLTLSDETEIAAVRALEGGGGSGIYHAQIEDLDLEDAAIAQERMRAFLDLHAPGRMGKPAGSMPREYRWVSDSHKFANADEAWVDDLMPGKIITFWPSTPITDNQEVVIQSVEIEDLPSKPEIFRYRVTAIDASRMSDFLDFYKALAELSPSNKTVTPASEVLDIQNVVFGIDTASVTSDLGWYPEISIASGRIWRPTSARISAGTPPVGSSILIDCQYSDDGGATWNQIFVNTTGDLELGAGLYQNETPLGRFYGFPDPLDIPARSLIKCAVIAVGSTTAGSNIIVDITGEVRKAAPVESIP